MPFLGLTDLESQPSCSDSKAFAMNLHIILCVPLLLRAETETLE